MLTEAVVKVSVGLGVSIVMLIISTSSVFKTKSRGPQVDAYGPMHIIWLSVTNPTLTHRMTRVVRPSAEHLRAAGMVNLVNVEDTGSVSPDADSGEPDVQTKGLTISHLFIPP